MEKILFLNDEEVLETVKEEVIEDEKTESVELTVCEKTMTDVIAVKRQKKIVRKIELKKVIPCLEKTFDVNIKKIDYFDLDNYGMGFAFFIN